MKKDICFQCEQEDIILEKEGVYSHCDYLNRKNDYENKVIEITKDNIHLYYEFMSGEDMKKYGYILDNIFDVRLDTLKKVFLNIQFEQLSSNTEYSFNITGLIVFGAKDILKPIDKYIEEIKASDAYKEYISKKA